MLKRALGKTGIQVSEIAFGCVEIGMPYGIGITSVQDMPSETESVSLLKTALDKGITFFDTARAYGISENLIGKAFENHRQGVIIATKCKHFMMSDGTVPEYHQVKTTIENSLKESLVALQTDYIDVFMLHQCDKQLLENKDISTVFNGLKQVGIIRATGVSTYTNEQTESAINAGCWDVIQVPFNLLDQRQSMLFDKAQAKGIGLVCRSVLLKGLLSDKGRNLHPALNNVEKHIQQYVDLTAAWGVSLSTLATQFALSFPQLSSVLVGIDKPDYLEQALNLLNGKYLNATQLKQAEALAYPDPEWINLPYWDKQGWLR